jgi:hypothetical protein
MPKRSALKLPMMMRKPCLPRPGGSARHAHAVECSCAVSSNASPSSAAAAA